MVGLLLVLLVHRCRSADGFDDEWDQLRASGPEGGGSNGNLGPVDEASLMTLIQHTESSKVEWSPRRSRTSTAGPAINPPGQWHAMVSYTQRNAQAKLLAETLYASLKERGFPVWLDVKMDQKNTAAMRLAAENSQCVIAVVTGAEREGDPEDNAYFKREYCVDELRWARQAGVPIQPVIRREDKERIGELQFLGQPPEDLKDLGNVEFLSLGRISPAIWQTCIDQVVKNVDKITCAADPGSTEPGPEPEIDGVSIEVDYPLDPQGGQRFTGEQGQHLISTFA